MEKETDEFLTKNEVRVCNNKNVERFELEPADKALEKSNNTFLYISAVTANLLMFACSSGFAWTSPALTSLKKSDAEVNPLGRPVTSLEESWITSLYCLGATAASPFAGKLSDIFGRKRLLLALAFPKIICLLVLAFATDIWIYYVTRFLMGLILGTVFTVLPMYLAEISELHNRGTVGAILNIFVNSGVLYVYIIGPYSSVKVLTLCCIIPLVLFLISFGFFVPESPIYLVSRKQNQLALKSLIQLRRKTDSQVQNELGKMVKMIETGRQQKGGISDLFKDRGYRKGLLICTVIASLQQFAGIYAVIAFMGPIFDATGTGISTYVATNLVGVIRVLGTIFTATVMEKFGRKTLLLISSLGSSASLFFLGLYFYLKYNMGYDMSLLFWLPVTSVITYMVSFNLGLSSIPFILPNEIFPPKVKAVASSMASFSCFFNSFLVTLIFPLMIDSCGMAVSFWLFLVCTLLGTVFIYLMVPETKGRAPEQVQQILNTK
ncbi:hypothetical protein JTB14_004057 [Gonioctena quinquepunctata]|nr:hypothetical protein JTB14_004057 [Gonioctena quinquepunctata]